jgi:Histidine phosphatase superfamily (branch 1)
MHVQILIVIRHGESEFNAAARGSPGWRDPTIFDPALTQTGCRQAVRLRAQLTEEFKHNPCLAGSPSILWVTSPLRRSLQTLLLSCPFLPEADTPSGVCSVSQQVQAKLDAVRQKPLPKIHVIRCGCHSSMLVIITPGMSKYAWAQPTDIHQPGVQSTVLTILSDHFAAILRSAC